MPIPIQSKAVRDQNGVYGFLYVFDGINCMCFFFFVTLDDNFWSQHGANLNDRKRWAIREVSVTSWDVGPRGKSTHSYYTSHWQGDGFIQSYHMYSYVLYMKLTSPKVFWLFRCRCWAVAAQPGKFSSVIFRSSTIIKLISRWWVEVILRVKVTRVRSFTTKNSGGFFLDFVVCFVKGEKTKRVPRRIDRTGTIYLIWWIFMVNVGV